MKTVTWIIGGVFVVFGAVCLAFGIGGEGFDDDLRLRLIFVGALATFIGYYATRSLRK